MPNVAPSLHAPYEETAQYYDDFADRRHAAHRGVHATFEVRDVRALDVPDTPFDAVISIDNSLPHLVEEGDLVAAARGMRRCLRDGGLAVLSMRDYDRHLAARPTATQPQVWDTPEGPRVAFQRWQWLTEECYEVEQFLIRSVGEGWQTASFRGATYRAWPRRHVTDCFLRAGFTSVDWMLPGETGFHQPLAVATSDRSSQC